MFARPAFILVLCVASVGFGGCVSRAQYHALQLRVNQLESRVDRDEHAMLTVDAKCDATTATVAQAVKATRENQRLAAEQRAALAEEREGIAQVTAMIANAQRAGAVLKPVNADGSPASSAGSVPAATQPTATNAAACASPQPVKVSANARKRM